MIVQNVHTMRGGLVLIWIFALVTKTTSIDVINRVVS
jgi:hypothetical protein